MKDQVPKPVVQERNAMGSFVLATLPLRKHDLDSPSNLGLVLLPSNVVNELDKLLIALRAVPVTTAWFTSVLTPVMMCRVPVISVRLLLDSPSNLGLVLLPSNVVNELDKLLVALLDDRFWNSQGRSYPSRYGPCP
jgi:hypothetical protein